MTNKFESIMERVGKDILVGWNDTLKYGVPAATLASLLFPPAAAPLAAAVNSMDLIQQAVLAVEQKFAAAGSATGTGTQKLAQVLTMVTPTVTQLLASEKISIDPTQITNDVNAVVAILNARQAPGPVAATPAPASPVVSGMPKAA